MIGTVETIASPHKYIPRPFHPLVVVESIEAVDLIGLVVAPLEHAQHSFCAHQVTCCCCRVIGIISKRCCCCCGGGGRGWFVLLDFFDNLAELHEKGDNVEASEEALVSAAAVAEHERLVALDVHLDDHLVGQVGHAVLVDVDQVIEQNAVDDELAL